MCTAYDSTLNEKSLYLIPRCFIHRDEEKLESNIYNSSRMSQTVISLKLGSLSSDTRLQDDIRISIPIDLSENETYAKDRSLVCVFWNDSLG